MSAWVTPGRRTVRSSSGPGHLQAARGPQQRHLGPPAGRKLSQQPPALPHAVPRLDVDGIGDIVGQVRNNRAGIAEAAAPLAVAVLILGLSVVRNLTAAAGSEKVSLRWSEVPNVSGYRVDYWLQDGSASRRSLRVDVPRAEVTGLENLKTYLFTVTPVDGAWGGTGWIPRWCSPRPRCG